MGTSACPRSSVEVGTDDVPLNEGGKSVFPFYEASHVRGRWRAPLLAEPDQTPHITMWHYGYGRLLRCGCAGSMRREGYGGCAGAVVLGYGRSAPLNTAVECSSSPQHRGSKATCRPPSPRRCEKNRKICSHRDVLCTAYTQVTVHTLPLGFSRSPRPMPDVLSPWTHCVAAKRIIRPPY